MAGETVSLSSVSAVRQAYNNPGAGLFAVEFPLTYSSTNNETNDVMEAGYLPAYAKVYAVGWYPTDMDTNVSPAAVHKVTVNSVDIVSGLTGAQTGTASLTPVTPTAAATAVATTDKLVTVTTTTAAATGAAGTARLVLWCQRMAA
jgi:hypothetical protein